MQAEAEEDKTTFMGLDPNSVPGTLLVAGTLCLACSLLVSAAAVGLKDRQEQNQLNKMRRNVLAAAGLWDKNENTDSDIEGLFEPIETVLVTLPDVEDEDLAKTILDEGPVAYDQAKAAKDPERSINIPVEQDVAGIKRREIISKVYLIKNDAGELETIVLPINGKGLWSTLFGFIALEADARTVKGITFYQHAETPGLGGEVDNPKWKALWPGKVALDESGEPVIEVTKPGNADSETEVDGLSGATITSNGVENTLRYWLGDHAFGPYLDQLRETGTIDNQQASGGRQSPVNPTSGLASTQRP